MPDMPNDQEVGRLVGEVAISYSVKELLARIEERQVRLDERISHLATADEVAQLRGVVNAHEARWNRILGASLAVAGLAGSGAGWVSSILTQ